MPGGIVPPEDLPGGLVPPDDLPSGEGALTRLARIPRAGVEALGEKAGFPTVGKVAGAFVPDTPAGWGALAGLTAAQAIPVVGQAATVGRFLPAAIRSGTSAVGAMLGSVAGGERDPLEVGKEGAIAAGSNIVGETVGKGLSAGKDYLVKQGKAGINATQKLLTQYGDELAKIIPGIQGQEFTPQRIMDLIVGKEGEKAVSAAYKRGIDALKNTVGKNAFVQDPRATRAVQLLGREVPLGQMTAPIREQGAKVPAHLVVGGEAQPIPLADAIKFSQELGAKARIATGRPEGDILAYDMRQANKELRDAIADTVDKIVPGTGDYYRTLNTNFRRGMTALEIPEGEAKKIFKQGPYGTDIDTATLARVHNMNQAKLKSIDAEELGAATRRGAPLGAGDVERKIPGTGIFFGGPGSLSGRVSEYGLTVPSYAGERGRQLPGPVSGYSIQRLVDEIRRRLANEEE